MKLNIGAGSNQIKPYSGEEWVCVDLVAGGVLADACHLPFRDNSFKEIKAIHVLEHIPRGLQDNFHQEMYRTLKPEGTYWIEVPDLFKICKNLVELGMSVLNASTKESIRCWTLSLYGKHRHKGDAHCWGFMSYLLEDDLRKNGFRNINKCTEMISSHHLMEPVILIRAEK